MLSVAGTVIVDQRRVLENGSSFQVIRAAEVVSPAQVLPEANWSTVADRLQRWSIGGARGAGRGVDPEGKVHRAVCDSRSWCQVCLLESSLELNNNIVARYEGGRGS